MKKLFMSAVLGTAMIAAGIPVLAQTATTEQGNSTATQQQGQQEHRRGNHMKYMAKELNLTQDQQDKLKPIFENQHQQMQAIRNDSSLTQDQKKAKMKELHESTQSQIDGILTPEQQQQWKQMRAKHHHGGNKQPSQTQAQ